MKGLLYRPCAQAPQSVKHAKIGADVLRYMLPLEAGAAG